MSIRVLFVIAVLLVVAAGPATLSADTLNIGLLSFDELIPSTTTAVNISNFTGNPATGGFAIPPDFIAFTPLTFLGATLTLTDDFGINQVIALGSLAPGPLLQNSGDPLFALQFPLVTAFTSIRFQATIAGDSILLSEGSSFVPKSLLLESILLPGGSNSISPGDSVALSIEGDILPTAPNPVPEPATLVLILSGLAGVAGCKRDLIQKSQFFPAKQSCREEENHD